MPDFKPQFKATGIGSMPLAEPDEALDLILASLPELPFWPQLMQRSPWEDMTLQFSPGLPALKIEPDLRQVLVDPEADLAEALTQFYEADLNQDWGRLGLTPETAAGFFALADRIAADKGGAERLKGQVTGPVTFCLSVKDQTGRPVLHNPELKEAYARGLGLKGGWQVRNFPNGLAPALIFIDEPALTGFGSAFMALDKEEAVALLNATAEPIHQAGGLVGIHVCGNTDWSMVLSSEVDVVNFDAADYGQGFVLYPKEIAAFLERGGVIAWGVVPTLTFTGQETPDGLAGRVESLIDQLDSQGLSRSALMDQALVTPACGLGPLDQDRARTILKLLADTSGLIRS